MKYSLSCTFLLMLFTRMQQRATVYWLRGNGKRREPWFISLTMRFLLHLRLQSGDIYTKICLFLSPLHIFQDQGCMQILLSFKWKHILSTQPFSAWSWKSLLISLDPLKNMSKEMNKKFHCGNSLSILK